MSTVLAVGDILRVTYACNNTNQVAFNTVFHRVSAVTGLGASDTACAQALDGLAAPVYRLAMGNTASYYGVKVQRISPTPVTFPAVSAANTGIGLMASEPLPGQVSGVVKGLTPFAGQRFRCRLYLPFPGRTGNDVVLNVPNGGFKVVMANLITVLYTGATFGVGLNTATIVPVIYHRDTHLTTDIIATQVAGKWGTQKRRGNYGQTNQYPPF